MTKSNYYSKAIESSYSWFEKFKKESLCTIDRGIISIKTWGELFDLERKTTYISKSSLNKVFTKNTAIVILGFSCSGKTTLAMNLQKKYPSAQLICFDYIGLKVLKENLNNLNISEENLDNQMAYLMGEKIEAAATQNTPLIIEGQYVYSNARGALFKTLRNYGYNKIILLSTLNIDPATFTKILDSRITDTIYWDNLKNKVSKQDFIKKQMELYGTDISRLKYSKMNQEQIRNTLEYKINEYHLKEHIQLEIMETMYPIQIEYNLLSSGADYFCDWF